jgi:hypothetical protein
LELHLKTNTFNFLEVGSKNFRSISRESKGLGGPAGRPERNKKNGHIENVLAVAASSAIGI